VLFSEPKIPQSPETAGLSAVGLGFSALQRAENSSMIYSTGYCVHHLDVSVLFSEPKIPQYRPNRANVPAIGDVSVLFSEPKIPQSGCRPFITSIGDVSVLFSEPKIPQFWDRIIDVAKITGFQCSSASRKFLN